MNLRQLSRHSPTPIQKLQCNNGYQVEKNTLYTFEALTKCDDVWWWTNSYSVSNSWSLRGFYRKCDFIEQWELHFMRMVREERKQNYQLLDLAGRAFSNLGPGKGPDLHLSYHQLITSFNNSTQHATKFPTNFQPGHLLNLYAWHVTVPDSF